MGLIKKIKDKLKLFGYGLVGGMKATEDQILRQSGTVSDGNISVVKEVEDNRVSKALLRGEVTQEVSELRYRTYLVDKESKKYKYYTPTLVLKRNKKTDINFPYNESDGLTLITSQLNDTISNEKYTDYLNIVSDVYEESDTNVEKNITSVNKRDLIEHFKETTEHRIKIEREKDFTPRYKIEDYIKRIDVKSVDEKHAVLELYVSKYMNSEDFKSKGFIKEIEKIRDKGLRSDMIAFKGISFITNHAFGIEDSIKFEFEHIHLIDIIEIDGNYVLRFNASFTEHEIDLTKKYYSKSMDMKYQNKEKKEITVNLADFVINEKYICDGCGKEVLYNMELMDKLEDYQGRDITDLKENEELSEQVTEFLDMQISKETFDRCLCTKCLKKFMKENNLI